MINNKLFQGTFWCYNAKVGQLLNIAQYTVITSKGKQKQKELSIDENYIHYSNNKSIEYQNLFLEFLKSQKLKCYGIKLSIDSDFLEIYGDIDKMVPLLIKKCFQLNFLSRYQVVRELSVHEVSKVYLIRNKTSSQELVAKTFYIPELLQKKSELESLKLEIEILRKIKHQNILELQEIFYEHEKVFLIFDYLKGQDLYQFSNKSKQSEDTVRIIISQLLNAINYLHTQGIFHRDIKPENIALKEQNNINTICLIDFGLADYYKNEGNYLYTRCGTPGYVAPEILHDKKYNQKVDIFSIGIITYELLNGKNPFADDDYQTLVQNNYHGLVDLSKISVSNDCFTFLLRLLNIDPEKRFSSTQALQHPFITQIHQQDFKIKSQFDRQRRKTIGLGQLQFSNQKDKNTNINQNQQGLNKKIVLKSKSTDLRLSFNKRMSLL